MSDDRKPSEPRHGAAAGVEMTGDPLSPDRRRALGRIGQITVASLVAAVAPRLVTARAAEVAPAELSRSDWAAIVDAARTAIAQGVDRWAKGAQISGGTVNGSGVFLPPGGLVGGPGFDAHVEKALLAVGTPPVIAAAFGGLAWTVWLAWADSYHAALPKAFPDFAAVPGPEADEVPMTAQKLHDGSAPGALGLSKEVLEPALVELIGNPALTPSGQNAIRRFARWYRGAFRRWFGKTELVNLLGSGAVPSFAPPYVPVGPVVAGVVSGFDVLNAPPFR